jgi:hypothetical protein
MQSIKEQQPFENCISSDPKPQNPEVKKIKFKLFGIQNVIKERKEMLYTKKSHQITKYIT